MIQKIIGVCMLQCFTIALNAQSPSIEFSGYIDTYFGYYTDSLPVGGFQQFPTVSPRSEQFGLNIAQLSAKFNSENVRANLTIHYGDIPTSAWSPGYNFLQEANVGVKLCKKLWLDAGFFRTHIGVEGLYPKENIASSISIPTYFEPYYEAGVRLNYLPTEKLTINLFGLNGYNVFNDNNRKKSVGLQANYAFSDQFNIGYGNYIGDESADEDSIDHLRIFNNILLNFEKKKFKLSVGLDYAMQQNSGLDNNSESASMVSGLVAIRYAAHQKVNIYLRGEMFNDSDGFLSGLYSTSDTTVSGLNIMGATLGIEYKPTLNSYIRLEGRDLMADESMDIFYFNKEFTNQRFEVLMNMGIWF